MKKLLLLIPMLFSSVSCMTATGPNGEKLAMVMTNSGFTTQNVRDSASGTRGIPLLGGTYDNQREQIPQEATQLTKITVGAISVEGVIDQGTPIDNVLGWGWRITRSIVTGQVFKTGITEYFGNKNIETAAEVTKQGVKVGSDTTLGLAKERANLIPKVDPEMVPIEPLKSP